MSNVRLLPLGDQAVMAYCADEHQATLFAALVRQAMPAWCMDVVQAYVSVAVYYDLARIDFAQAADWLAAFPIDEDAVRLETSRLHVVPCCYELGLDFERIQQHTNLSQDQIIALHAGTIYTIYAIGFCPGFPYLGYLPAELSGVPRLASPRLRVEVGSVGLTGRQTGIYTELRPGGWNIVGRTPFVLVDVRNEYFPLRTGDRVRFLRITEAEFRTLEGKRLSEPEV